MIKTVRPFAGELLWLALSFLLTILIAFFVCGRALFTGSLDIHFLDTYYVLAPWTVICPLYFLVTFLIFIGKEIRNGFGKAFPAVVILLTGLLLIVVLTIVNKEFMILGTKFSGGWIAYPPLSALPDVHIGKSQENPVAKALRSTLYVLQLAITLVLLFVCFRCGQKNARQPTMHRNI